MDIPEIVVMQVRDGFYKLHQEIMKEAVEARVIVVQARSRREGLRRNMAKLEELSLWLLDHNTVKSDNFIEKVQSAKKYISRELDGVEDE